MSLIITNRTAFPLNLALLHLQAPVHHFNCLEPGDSWNTTSSPPSFRSKMDSCTNPIFDCLPTSLEAFLLSDATTTIQVFSDNELNRYDVMAANQAWTSTVLCRLAMPPAITSFCLFGAIRLYKLVAVPSLVPLYHLYSAYAVACAFACLSLLFLIISYRESLSSQITHSGASKPAIVCSIPRNTLLPLAVPFSSSVTSSTGHPFSSATPARHLAVVWSNGRVRLWDVDYDQEMLSHHSS